eukprot:5078106-Prymnesium_polylepis.1
MQWASAQSKVLSRPPVARSCTRCCILMPWLTDRSAEGGHRLRASSATAENCTLKRSSQTS